MEPQAEVAKLAELVGGPDRFSASQYTKPTIVAFGEGQPVVHISHWKVD